MWTTIKKEKFNNFIEAYPNLEEYNELLKLITINNTIVLPKFFYFNYPHENLTLNDPYDKDHYNTINIKFNGELRPLQKKVIERIKEIYNNKKSINGIIKLFPSAGKTILGIYIASLLKLRTLIIVDKDKLMKQWIKEIHDFSNIKEDNIGIIKGNIYKIKDINVAMLQTLSSKLKNDTSYINKINNERIGLIIYDEVHDTSCTEKYAKISTLFSTENIIGLSATPFHKGSHEILMKNTIGDIIYSSKDYDLQPTYYMINYNSEMNKFPIETKSGKYIPLYNKINLMNRYELKLSLYNKYIVKSKHYWNNIITVLKNLKKMKYNTIVMCWTIEQVKTLSKKLEEEGISNRRFYSKETKLDEDIDDLIITTYKYSYKGLNIKKLSALLVISPLSGRKSVIQMYGRILRIDQGKLQPIVIDFYDNSFPNMFINIKSLKQNIIQNEFNKCKIYDLYDGVGQDEISKRFLQTS